LEKIWAGKIAIGRTSDELIMAHSYQFVHGRTNHVLSDHDRTGDAIHLAKPAFTFLITNLWEISFGILECASHSYRVEEAAGESAAHNSQKQSSASPESVHVTRRVMATRSLLVSDPLPLHPQCLQKRAYPLQYSQNNADYMRAVTGRNVCAFASPNQLSSLTSIEIRREASR
jgi:hypothetical protein